MSRTRTISHHARKERAAYMPATEKDVYKPAHAQLELPGARTMYPHRPIMDERDHPQATRRAVSASAMLAVLGSMPRNGVSVNPRNPRVLATSILTNENLRRHHNYFSDKAHFDPDILEQALSEMLPDFREPIGRVSVKGAVQLGDEKNPTTPTLALELDSPQIQHEINEMNAVVGSLRGIRYTLTSVPHISIASFSGIDTIPQTMLDAVEAAVPDEIAIDSGSFYS